MPRTRIAIRISREEYDSFVKIIGTDEKLPAAYDDWIKRTTKENEQLRARGEIVNEVDVQAEEFAAYCRLTGQEPSYVLLEAFAVKESRR